MFETAFRMASSSPSDSSGRLRSLPLSIALHGLLVGAAVLFTARAVIEPSEEQLPIRFIEGSAPPPFQGAASEPEFQKPETHAEAAALTEPAEISSEVENPPQPPEASSRQQESAAGDLGQGDPEGKPNGRDGGLTDSSDKEGKNLGDSERPFFPGGNITEPRLLRRVEPDYPEAARKARLEGTVVLEAIIGRSGQIEQLRVVHSGNPLLDAAAVRAVEQWRYRPATLNGRAVRVYLTVTVEFRLR